MASDVDGPTAEAAVYVAASPERVWALVSDIHLIASLSAEVQDVAWLDGAIEAAPGARFRGRNRHRAVGEWSSTSHVVECVAPRVFTWVVGDLDLPSATWGFELTAGEGGTQLRQWVRLGAGPTNLDRMIEAMPERADRIVAGRVQEFRTGIDANLAALTQLAEQDLSPPTRRGS